MPSPAFVPWNPNSEEERQRLLHQRVLCGWCQTEAWIDKWAANLDKQPFYWIMLGDECVGHISLELVDMQFGDPEYASPETNTVGISKLFLLESARGGLGTACFKKAEDIAVSKLGAKRLVLHAVSDSVAPDSWYYMRDGAPRKFSLISWYNKMGYKAWKDVPRYPYVDEAGREQLCPATYLYKDL